MGVNSRFGFTSPTIAINGPFILADHCIPIDAAKSRVAIEPCANVRTCTTVGNFDPDIFAPFLGS
jgi:hypothetical protein